jgi:hypothetical protein
MLVYLAAPPRNAMESLKEALHICQIFFLMVNILARPTRRAA